MVPLRDQYSTFSVLKLEIPMMEYVQDKATGETFWTAKLTKVTIVKEVTVRFRMLTILLLLRGSS